MGLFGGLGKAVGGFFGGPLGSAAGGFIGDYIDEQGNRHSAEAQNEWNADQAAENRRFQLEMSSTAYQRAVNDMAKAGLNPMLAYSQGGASTGSGAVAAPASNVRLSGLQGQQVAAQTANTAASTELIRAQTDKVAAEKALLEAQAGQATSSAGHLEAQKDQIRQNMQMFEDQWDKLLIENQTLKYRQVGEHADARVKWEGQDSRIRAMASEAEKLANQAKLLGLEVPRSVSEAAFWSSKFGKDYGAGVQYGTRQLGSILGSANQAKRFFGE